LTRSKQNSRKNKLEDKKNFLLKPDIN